jgi:hypothetical protein
MNKIVHLGSPIAIRRRISTPVPKQEISSPDTRLINPRFATLIRERTDPMDPQSTTHHTVEPKKTPATNYAADREDVPWITKPYPGKITKKKTRVSGFAIARATMDRQSFRYVSCSVFAVIAEGTDRKTLIPIRIKTKPARKRKRFWWVMIKPEITVRPRKVTAA